MSVCNNTLQDIISPTGFDLLQTTVSETYINYKVQNTPYKKLLKVTPLYCIKSSNLK